MLKKIANLLPTSALNFLHNITFELLEKRGEIVFADNNDDNTYNSEYQGFTIKVEAISDESFTCFASVYKDEKLVYPLEDLDDGSSTTGEAELIARQWIDELVNNSVSA
jgi:hypothetical protein